MLNNKSNTKGVSLPLVIGLITFLMVAIVAINTMVIRSIQSVRSIEASSRAYFAAEAGIEDALYELTPHFAGYETPNLGNANARNNNFVSDIPCEAGIEKWCNEWEIESRNGDNEWGGRLYSNQKMMLYLFNDTHEPLSTPATNAINREVLLPNDIETLKIVSSDFSITFSIPDTATIFANGGSLKIDNDEDFDGSPSTVNEDPEEAFGACDANTDCDNDGLVNEDGPENPVILWKLTDGESRSLIPLNGCLSDSDTPPGTKKSELCEKDFNTYSDSPYTLTDYAIRLDNTAYGQNEMGQMESIGNFISNLTNTDKARFEFLIIAPMEHVDELAGRKIEIPYILYEVSSMFTNELPYPFFRIKSDGYFRGFKQSITATVTPKTTVPLFDFTIIQQQ